jgi:uncharacterized membrane protein (DUF106 family)
MKKLHCYLIKLATISVPLSLILGTVGGFLGLGFNPFSGFKLGMAIMGAIIGLISSALAAAVLVILLEQLAAIQRIEAAVQQRPE